MQGFLDIWPVLGFMAVQTVAVAWWASNITTRVGQIEKDHADMKAVAVDIGVLKSSLSSLHELVAHMSGRLDALAERKPR